MAHSQNLGNQAEKLALEYMISQGLTLVKANFYSRFGEIDLIMRDSDSFVFVEVRLRKSGFLTALESITPAKQRKLIKTAEYFLSRVGNEANCRFDALVINGVGQIEWYKNVIFL